MLIKVVKKGGKIWPNQYFYGLNDNFYHKIIIIYVHSIMFLFKKFQLINIFSCF